MGNKKRHFLGRSPLDKRKVVLDLDQQPEDMINSSVTRRFRSDSKMSQKSQRPVQTNKTESGQKAKGHMAGDLICPNVQSKKYPVHGSWIKFKDKFPDLDWSKAVEYSDEGKGKGSGKGKKGTGSGTGKSSKGNSSRNPTNGRFQTNTVQVQDGQVEPGFEFAER